MTTEELEQIGKVIEAKLDEKLEPITKRLETVEKNMATRQDIVEVRQEMATKDDLKNMSTKADIYEITEDMAGFFHKTWEKMDETNERVTTIEDQLDMPTQKRIKLTSKKHWCASCLRTAHTFSGC